MRRSLLLLLVGLVVGSLVITACVHVRSAVAQPGTIPTNIPTPESVIGHEVGADYKLARWETIVDYFDRLGAASDRINVRRLDTSTEGNPYLRKMPSAPTSIHFLAKFA